MIIELIIDFRLLQRASSPAFLPRAWCSSHVRALVTSATAVWRMLTGTTSRNALSSRATRRTSRSLLCECSGVDGQNPYPYPHPLPSSTGKTSSFFPQYCWAAWYYSWNGLYCHGWELNSEEKWSWSSTQLFMGGILDNLLWFASVMPRILSGYNEITTVPEDLFTASPSLAATMTWLWVSVTKIFIIHSNVHARWNQVRTFWFEICAKLWCASLLLRHDFILLAYRYAGSDGCNSNASVRFLYWRASEEERQFGASATSPSMSFATFLTSRNQPAFNWSPKACVVGRRKVPESLPLLFVSLLC